MATYLEEAEILYPNLSGTLLQLFAAAWAKSGNAANAIAEVRLTDEYKTEFPGNYNPETGQVRYNEVTYKALEQSYIGTLAEYGIPRETSKVLLAPQFVQLLEGEVSAREFQQRVSAAYEGIVDNIQGVQNFFSTNYNVDLTPEAIFMGALDPAVGEEIVSGRITASQIGGEASRAGFTITRSDAENLRRAGLTQEQARQLYTAAQTQLPRLRDAQSIVEPGATPITLEEFTQAVVFQDPEQLENLRRIEAEEKSLFTPIGGPARQGARVTGLVEG
tara:strand:- start:231 stop:1058 length:828 start_codon:yes stop_codon:yes gene_type:complete